MDKKYVETINSLIHELKYQARMNNDEEIRKIATELITMAHQREMKLRNEIKK